MQLAGECVWIPDSESRQVALVSIERRFSLKNLPACSKTTRIAFRTVVADRYRGLHGNLANSRAACSLVNNERVEITQFLARNNPLQLAKRWKINLKILTNRRSQAAIRMFCHSNAIARVLRQRKSHGNQILVAR